MSHSPPPVSAGRRSRLLTAAGGGIGVAGLIGTVWGLGLGVVAAVVAERLLRRREPAHQRKERLAAMADLPLGADLLAAARWPGRSAGWPTICASTGRRRPRRPLNGRAC